MCDQKQVANRCERPTEEYRQRRKVQPRAILSRKSLGWWRLGRFPAASLLSPSPCLTFYFHSPVTLWSLGLNRHHLSRGAGRPGRVKRSCFHYLHPPSGPSAPSLLITNAAFDGLRSQTFSQDSQVTPCGRQSKINKYMFIVALMAIYFITVNYKLPRAVRWKTHIPGNE